MTLIADNQNIVKLSESQYNILVMLAHGYTRRQIAEHLDIQLDSVRSAVQRIYVKLKIDQTILDVPTVALLLYWGIATYNEEYDTLEFHGTSAYTRPK
jgi:DNA-binding NarL/FixJ family response regulator